MTLEATPMRDTDLACSVSSSTGKLVRVGRPPAAAARGTVTRTANRAECSKDIASEHTSKTNALCRRGGATQQALDENKPVKKDAIVVAVRFRPLSKKEKLRGDEVLWQVDPANTVGLVVRGTFKPKFNYDTVFRDSVDNQEVYNSVASDIVATAMGGINGTIFAYGVTSSGKTHTMMGDQHQPGIVPQAICQVFEIIESMPSKEFLLRLSVMEIYNEILNDLLDRSHSNLKIREHKTKGVHIDGLKEEVVLSAEHALSLIARGEANRKVSCTAFNEDSSRSHIICRLSIEACDRVADEELRSGAARTLSYLNLIDLAGSESAKAAMSRGHRREGSYINKSLLTLGTVIHKMSDRGAIHIPFRDSKLTRLLQSSLSGNGAKVAIICTVTPASMQAEETHNTLKFASRAKKIEIKCSKNQIMSSKSLILRYQAEIKDLRKQLANMPSNGAAKVSKDSAVLHEEICVLRNRLEEELRWHVEHDVERKGLEAKIQRLTRLILTSTRSPSCVDSLAHQPHQRSRSAEARRTSGKDDSALCTSCCEYKGNRHSEDYMSRHIDSPKGRLAHGIAQNLHQGDLNVLPNSKIKHLNRQLKDQVELMAFVLDQRERDVVGLKAQLLSQTGKPVDLPCDAMVGEEHSDVLQNSLEFVKQENARLTADLVRTKVELKRIQTDSNRASDGEKTSTVSKPEKQLLFAPSSLTRTDSSVTDTTQVEIGKVSPYPETPGSMRSLQGNQFSKHDAEMQEKVAKLDQRVHAALSDLTKKEMLLGKINYELKGMRNAKNLVEQQLGQLKGANEALQSDLQNQELVNNRLQGYLLDGMSSEELNDLILGLTQAAQRVRLTVQLRRLSGMLTTSHSMKCDLDNKETCEDTCH